MILIMLGPPGSGKGTQSTILSKKMDIPALSTGQMLRDIMNNDPDSELSSLVKNIISRGDLVSDDVMTDVLTKRITNDDCANGVILDGYPRNIKQAKIFENILHDISMKEYLVLYFKVSDDILIERIAGRYSCSHCNAQYHKKFMKPTVDEVCDYCGSTEFTYRADDSKDAVKNRLAVYNDQTHPLVDHFESLDRLVYIDASLSVTEITDEIMAQLNLRNVAF